MGQYTEAYVNICVANSQKAEELFAHLQEMNTIVAEKYQGESNYYDHEIFHGKEFSEIRIQFSSGRYANCEWQGEILIAESLPYYKDIIEFEFNIPNCESYWIGDEPEEWEEGGGFYKVAQRIEQHRLERLEMFHLNKAVSLNRSLKYQTPRFVEKEGKKFCTVSLIDFDEVKHDFEFEMYENQDDFWEGGQVGNLSFDLNYFADEPNEEDHHIGIYLERLDGTIEHSNSFLCIPLAPLPEISLSSDLEPDTGVPIKFVADNTEGYISAEDGLKIRLIDQFDARDEFNLRILVGDKEALAVSVDFDFPKQIKTKSYLSIHDFVAENSLKDEAVELFGEGWEAEEDCKQAQELCNHITNGKYFVIKNNGQLNSDYEFQIVK